MSSMGGPVEAPSGESWRSKASGTASRLVTVFEKKRLAMRLHLGDLCISTWRALETGLAWKVELSDLKVEAQVISTCSWKFPKLAIDIFSRSVLRRFDQRRLHLQHVDAPMHTTGHSRVQAYKGKTTEQLV